MKLNNKQIVDCLSGLNLLSKSKFPIHLSYKIDIIRQNLEPYALMSNNNVLEMKKEFAKKNKNGTVMLQKNEKGEPIPNSFLFEEKDMPELITKINEILEQEIELPDHITLSVSEFPADTLIEPNILSHFRGILK